MGCAPAVRTPCLRKGIGIAKAFMAAAVVILGELKAVTAAPTGRLSWVTTLACLETFTTPRQPPAAEILGDLKVVTAAAPPTLSCVTTLACLDMLTSSCSASSAGGEPQSSLGTWRGYAGAIFGGNGAFSECPRSCLRRSSRTYVGLAAREYHDTRALLPPRWAYGGQRSPRWTPQHVALSVFLTQAAVLHADWKVGVRIGEAAVPGPLAGFEDQDCRFDEAFCGHQAGEGGLQQLEDGW